MQKTILVSFLLASASLLQAQTYDPAVQFSPTSNPTGPWSYGYESTTLGTAFTLLNSTLQTGPVDAWLNTSVTYSVVSHNPATTAFTEGSSGIVWNPGELAFHPGDGAFTLIRFLAPAAGLYQLTVDFYGIDENGPGDQDVHVLTNNASAFSGIVTGYRVPTSFSAQFNLLGGDLVDFAVGPGPEGSVWGGTTAIDAQLTIVPEPSTLILLGLGSFLAASARRRSNVAS